MKKFTLLVIVAFTLFCSCDQLKRNEFRIYPLSPFSDVMKFAHDEDISKEMKNGLKTQYYIVDEDIEYNDHGKIRMQNFIDIKLKEAVRDNKAIYFTFYKGSFSFNRNSVQTKQQLVDDHIKDKIAEFEYKDGKFYNFDFFKEGKYYEPPIER